MEYDFPVSQSNVEPILTFCLQWFQENLSELIAGILKLGKAFRSFKGRHLHQASDHMATAVKARLDGLNSCGHVLTDPSPTK